VAPPPPKAETPPAGSVAGDCFRPREPEKRQNSAASSGHKGHQGNQGRSAKLMLYSVAGAVRYSRHCGVGLWHAHSQIRRGRWSGVGSARHHPGARAVRTRRQSPQLLLPNRRRRSAAGSAPRNGSRGRAARRSVPYGQVTAMRRTRKARRPQPRHPGQLWSIPRPRVRRFRLTVGRSRLGHALHIAGMAPGRTRWSSAIRLRTGNTHGGRDFGQQDVVSVRLTALSTP